MDPNCAHQPNEGHSYSQFLQFMIISQARLYDYALLHIFLKPSCSDKVGKYITAQRATVPT